MLYYKLYNNQIPQLVHIEPHTTEVSELNLIISLKKRFTPQLHISLFRSKFLFYLLHLLTAT